MDQNGLKTQSDITFLFSSMERLPPRVITLIYWKRPVESAIVMATGFTLLLSLGCLSFISVVAYVCLTILCCTGAARVYYDLIASKRDETAPPPFSDWFTKDKEDMKQRINVFVNDNFDVVDVRVRDLRHYLLIENYVDSLKFALLMYLLSIVGGFFNLMTLVLIVFLFAFSVPKVYDIYHVQIERFSERPKAEIRKVWEKTKDQLCKIPYFNKQKAN